MGALPSRESHEGPNTVYFGNNTGVVTFRLPMTPHFFPSADCLAFKEVHRVRDSQSCKYSFNIREASAVLPEQAAVELKRAQEEYWGPEAEAVDPSLHYHDDEIYEHLVENGFVNVDGGGGGGESSKAASAAALKHQHIRRSIERRQELYQKLVIEPTADALVDTDDEMRELYFQEQRWRAARDVVRRHRAFVKQQTMTAEEKAELDVTQLVAVDVSATELEAAEAVAPPQKWLRPIPEVVVERMSMADACMAHRNYRERHGLDQPQQQSQQQNGHQSRNGEVESPPGPVHRCNRGRGVAIDVHAKCDEVALNVLDYNGRQPLVENETLNEEMLKSYPGFQDNRLPFEMDESYMDGRVHMVAYQGVNYLFAYNPDYVRAMGKTVVVDGSLVEERRRLSGAVQSARCRPAFTTTHTVATRQAEDFEDPNQRRAYEIFQPVYARYYIPVMPVRVLGVDGFIPCREEPSSSSNHHHHHSRSSSSSGKREVRGAAWMRGVADDEEEEAYEERVLAQKYGVSPPPVLRSCRFVHAVIGDKILNRMSVLGCMTFRERCINAGLPDAIACPLWGVMALNDIPQLQFQREIELRLLAAIHEIDDGDMRIRDALAKQHRWNNYVDFTNSPMYGFMVSAPPERRFKTDADGTLREVAADGDDDAESCCSEAEGEAGTNDEHAPKQRSTQKSVRSNMGRNSSSGGPLKVAQQRTGITLEPTREEVDAEEAVQNEQTGCDVLKGDQSSADTASHATGSERQLLTLSLTGATSSHSSDTESRDEQLSGSTSARSAAHTTSLTSHSPTEKARVVADIGSGTGGARVKRTREGQTCIGGCAPPATAEQATALQTAMTNVGISLTCAATANSSEDDALDCLAEPPVELRCLWSFKRRRLGVDEEVIVDPNFSEEAWMPMVNPLTKDTALALLGVRVSMRGRLALVRYSARAMHKVVYYLSQASAPIFCLPYVGPPQQCANVAMEGVLRVTGGTPASAAAPQNGLPPPTRQQIETAVAAYAQGKVRCYVYVNTDDHISNPPTSCCGNHFRDDELMTEAVEVGITSQLILAQMPVKADCRRALDWYRKSLPFGPATLPPLSQDQDDEEQQQNAAKTSAPYASWPALLDAPAPCDGDVLVVCPRTHRWIRVSTLMTITALLQGHAKARLKSDELANPVPVLQYFSEEAFHEEVGICFDALTHKNMDSEGMQCHMLHMRHYFSYNGIVELVLDRLRTIADQERYEDKDDDGWLILHEPPASLVHATTNSSLTSTPTTASGSVAALPSTSSGSLRGPCGLPNTGASAFTTQKYVESGSYFIWSFLMAGQRYFFGTKPRFIRLALQRQKQNQRRRQKRKERDGGAGGVATTTTTVAANKNSRSSNNNNNNGSGNNGDVTSPTTSHASVSHTNLKNSSIPRTGVVVTAADQGPNGYHSSGSSSATMAISPPSTAAAPRHSTLNSSSHSHGSSSNSGGNFQPQTTFTPVPTPSHTAVSAMLNTTSGPDMMPITAADYVQLAHNNNNNNNQRNGVAGAPEQPRHPRHATSTASTTHIPYAPLHMTMDDRLVNDERGEMQACRQQHNQWMQSHGVLIAPECYHVAINGGIMGNNNGGGDQYPNPNHYNSSSSGFLPSSVSADCARWALPPLAGQPSCRQRVVVPVGPHGIGQPRLMTCDAFEKSCCAARGQSLTAGEARASLARANEEGSDGGEGGEVPVQRPGSPRVMDAQRTSYRWNPYQVGE